MPTKGISRVKKNFRITMEKLATDRQDKAVYAILSQGAAIADTLTPVATSTLLNSRYAPQIDASKKKVTGHVGYTAIYAGTVHDAPGKNKGKGVLRDPSNPGLGEMWDPNAEPRFLEKGFEELKPMIPALLRRICRV